MLTLLGFRADGRPIYCYMGGSEGAPEGDGDAGDGDDDGDDGDGDEGQLTPGGLKAIERARADAKKARAAARPYVSLARELGLTPEQMREKLLGNGKKDQEDKVDIEQVWREAAQAAMTAANKRILRSEVKALAANDFADPEDVARFLDLDEDGLIDDEGNVDAKALKRSLKDLLASKPYLAKTSAKGDFEGGARRTADAPQDMNARIRNLARRG